MCDFYKLSHRSQYPSGTEKVYSTWTPRSNKHLKQVDEIVVFGVQGAIFELKEIFDEYFFNKSIGEVLLEYKRIMKNCLGVLNPDTSHIEELHALGMLPLEFKSLPEGSVVPVGVPYLTVENTLPSMFWLTNYIETYLSTTLWKPATVASIARKYRKILDKAAEKTSDSGFLVDFQGHDFSMRGVGGVEDAARSGAGHLLSFVGTDTIPAITYLEQYYFANVDKELVGTSVPATEHSVSSSNILYIEDILRATGQFEGKTLKEIDE